MLFFALCQVSANAQLANYSDSLKKYNRLYRETKADKNLMQIYFNTSASYRQVNNDSAMFYGRLLLTLAKKDNDQLFEMTALDCIQFAHQQMGNLPEALNTQLQYLELARQSKREDIELRALNWVGNSYTYMDDLRTALGYYRASLAKAKKVGNVYFEGNELSNIGYLYELLHMPDSALYYENMVYNRKGAQSSDLFPELMWRMGNAFADRGNYVKALQYYKKGIPVAEKLNLVIDKATIQYQMARVYDSLGLLDSAIYYARKSLLMSRSISMRKTVLDASQFIADVYGRQKKTDSAYYYQLIAKRYNDTLYGVGKFSRIQRILSNEQRRQQVLLQKQEDLKNRYRLFGGVAIIIFVVIVALLIWRNNLKQKQTNLLLSEQKEEIQSQRDNIGLALEELKNTQTQLIQSEKMASLGELTAGIAHEIQNPLNFVNNFSDVSAELVVEMQEELNTGDKEEAIAISEDIKQNLEKIRHHGKRADAIVKGMLQHSQSGSGTKEPTDINALAEECMRLSYHGLRAKDASFNAEMVNHFDSGIPKVNVIPQDISRVMLNLFNNAFYAVNQEQKTAGEDYKPEVSVATSAENGNVIIKVKDNGTGIPDAVKEKIMQPFFTTKPTGEGTGLGLSLTYDMVVKGHGGSIRVNSSEGEGSEFIIQLPIN